MPAPAAQGQPPRRASRPRRPAADAGAAAAGSAAAAIRARAEKKKFFQKNAAPAAQPGNSVHAPQGKRKGRQKGPRAFVGPMDHSYRAVNGNVADGPPSTIPTASNGHSSGYYPDVYTAQPAAPVREDAPTRIYCFIEDLFFLAKIQETARKLGVKVGFVKGDKESVERILESPEDAAAGIAGLRPEQSERQAHDADSEIQNQVQEGGLDHRLPESSAGRPEDEGDGGGMRHGDAALGLLAKPADPAAPLRRGRGRGILAAAGVLKAGNRE